MKLKIYSIFLIWAVLVTPVIAKSEQDGLLKALVAEFYLQQREFEKSFALYEELAQINDSAAVLKRLFEISLAVGDLALIEKASLLMIIKNPDDISGNQNYLVALIGQKKSKLAKAQLRKLYKLVKTKNFDLEKIVKKLVLVKQNKFVASLLEDLLSAKNADKEDLHALAVYYSLLTKYDKALAKVEQSIKLDKTWAKSNNLKARILYTQDKTEEALSYIRDFFTKNYSVAAGTVYARMLVGSGKFDESIKVYERIIKDDDSLELKDSLAGLYANNKRYPEALKLYTELVNEADYRSEAHYYIGLINKELGKFDVAKEHLNQVDVGEFYLDARLNFAILLAKEDIKAAVGFLDTIEVDDLGTYNRIVGAKAEIYKNVKNYKKAYETYSEAINKHYLEDINQRYISDLLYDRAILAEKMGSFDSMEDDFLKIIENDPDDADTLNALGYSLADKTDRFLEALGYIEKALKIEPKKFYILDSMGWVQYKLGRIDVALKYLLKAYRLSQDPEVAAHLSEVYLHAGDKAHALKYLKSGINTDDKHPAVLKIKKLLEEKGVLH